MLKFSSFATLNIEDLRLTSSEEIVLENGVNLVVNTYRFSLRLSDARIYLQCKFDENYYLKTRVSEVKTKSGKILYSSIEKFDITQFQVDPSDLKEDLIYDGEIYHPDKIFGFTVGSKNVLISVMSINDTIFVNYRTVSIKEKIKRYVDISVGSVKKRVSLPETIEPHRGIIPHAGGSLVDVITTFSKTLGKFVQDEIIGTIESLINGIK